MYTLSKIADELGVCKATVSLVMNGKAKHGRISDETVRKVRDFCAKVNYLPNIHARRMNLKIVKNLLMLLNDQDGITSGSSFAEYNVGQILGGVAATAAAAGYVFTLRVYSAGMSEKPIFDSFRNREIDGMIFYGLNMPDTWIDQLTAEARRVVGIGIAPSGKVPSVNIDNRDVSRALADHLLDRGHRRFVYLRGVEISHPGAERFAGFREALAARGVAFDVDRQSLYGGFSEELATAAIAGYLAGGAQPPDAVVCANDRMALGAMAALRQAGLRVPDDVAIAGGDNIDLGRYTTPTLTTFDNQPFELGAAACRLLLDAIGGVPATDTTLRSRLVLRASA